MVEAGAASVKTCFFAVKGCVKMSFDQKVLLLTLLLLKKRQQKRTELTSQIVGRISISHINFSVSNILVKHKTVTEQHKHVFPLLWFSQH